MTEQTMLALLAAGGVGYLLVEGGGGFSPTDPATPGAAPADPATRQSKTTAAQNAVVARIAAAKGPKGPGGLGRFASRLARNGGVQNVADGNGSASGLPREVEERMKAEMKRHWEAMSGEAKVKACEKLKTRFPNDPGIQAYDCAKAANATFQTVLTLTAAAVGMALCGPPCSTVGVLAAAIGGPKLEEWADAAWKEAETIGGKIGDAAEDLWDYVF
jgi:hypothetical protein